MSFPSLGILSDDSVLQRPEILGAAMLRYDSSFQFI